MLPVVAPWFVVVPDAASASRVVAALRARCPGLRDVPHASGRPWIVGEWADEDIAVGRAGGRALAVIGEHAASAASLSALARRVHTLADVDGVSGELPGSVHLVASVAGAARVQGTVSGLRRVYGCRVGGVPVAADQAGVLAQVLRAPVDAGRVAARLVFPAAPWPLSWDAMWKGVDAVPPGHCLMVDPRGGSRTARWWSPPAAEVPGPEGAEALREALREAVRVRLAGGGGGPVVSHLSGLDSSSVCSLAVREGAEVVALTASQPDPMDDDVAWAGRTAAGLRESGHGLRHDVVPADECPLVYDGMLGVREAFDEPFPFTHNHRRFVHLLERGLGHGARVQLMGAGGDELVTPGFPWLAALLRESPRLGLRRVRAVAGRQRRPLLGTLHGLLRHRSHAAWLLAQAERLAAPAVVPAAPEPGLGWGVLAVLPPWVTAGAREAVVEQLRRAAVDAGNAEDAEGLAAERGMHHDLSLLHAGAQAMRGYQQIGARLGARMAAPFHDDRVVDAALSVRIADRLDPARYKPLLVEAMRGIVPDVTLGRVTKSDTTATAVLGGRAHRDQITGLVAESRVARLGLVDEEALRHHCHGPLDVMTPALRVEPFLGAESWLRTCGAAEDRDEGRTGEVDGHVRLG